jgi:hypothetical protein
VKKKLTPIEQAALKHGLKCVTLRKGGKDQTHCAAWPKRQLLEKLKGSMVGGMVSHPGNYKPTGNEIFHEAESAKKPAKKKRAKRA